MLIDNYFVSLSQNVFTGRHFFDSRDATKRQFRLKDEPPNRMTTDWVNNYDIHEIHSEIAIQTK